MIFTTKETLERITAQFIHDNLFVRVERVVDLIQQGKGNDAMNKNEIRAELDASNEMVNEGQVNVDAAKLDEDSTQEVRA